VHSPLSWRALASGAASMVGRDARDAVARELQARFGPVALRTTASGTAALTLALRAAAKAGAAPVALPAYSCFDIATAADGADVPVMLYDLDVTTLAPDPASLDAALAAGARTVVVAHLYGIPADMDVVQELVRAGGALVVDDAAQGAGATWRGRPLGTLGSLGVLSFGRGKGVTAGRGGALLAMDGPGRTALEAVASVLDAARLSPAEPFTAMAQWLLARPSLYGIPASLPFLGLGETVYHPPETPRAMSRFAAGVLASTLALAASAAERRRATAARWQQALALFAPSALLVPRAPAGGVSGALRQPVVVGTPELREYFSSSSARALGVLPGYPSSLADLEGFQRRIRNADNPFPTARRLATSLYTIPTHGQLTAHDLARIDAWLRRAPATIA
jgi:dTDP-4-amino-4,6-dideoxygalactose transaminase